MVVSNLPARDLQLCREMAAFYRLRGWQPLPSKDKRPMLRYAHAWEERIEEDLFARFRADAIQLMLGRYWRLLVIDADGPEGRTRFDALAEVEGGRVPATWVTHSGGDGLHYWFRLPEGLIRPIPKAVLWKGRDRHSAIERLCDRSLIMAPPSIHPRTGARYKFLDRSHSPMRLPLPALCPGWILGLRPVEAPRPKAPAVSPIGEKRRVVVTARGRYRAADVLDAIPDKIGLVRQWGLRVASDRPNGAGWCPCHAIGREDRTPSASVSATTGRYWEPGEPMIGLFELGVRLGVYLDFRDAVTDLGSRYRAREAG